MAGCVLPRTCTSVVTSQRNLRAIRVGPIAGALKSYRQALQLEYGVLFFRFSCLAWGRRRGSGSFIPFVLLHFNEVVTVKNHFHTYKPFGYRLI